MGKAQILSGGTDGLYNIKLLKEETKALALKTSLETKLATLNADVPVKRAEFQAAVAAFEAKKVELTNTIAAYNAKTVEISAVQTAQSAMIAAYTNSIVKQKAYNRIVAEITSIQKQLNMIDNVLVVENRSGVWCADLTEDLTGEVGTIEINGEDNEILVMPSGQAGLGAIQEAGAGTPAGVFYDWAVRPGWQKFKPTYRVGTITTIDGDTCSVSLNAAASSDQGLDINQATVLTNVPIEYMTCNGGAFRVDDEVVIEFGGQNWNSPKVVGFRTNPQGCGSLWVIPYKIYTGATFTLQLDSYGEISTPIPEIEYWVRLIKFNGIDTEYEIVDEFCFYTRNEASCEFFDTCVEYGIPNEPIYYLWLVKTPYLSTYYNGQWYHFYLASPPYRSCSGRCTLDYAIYYYYNDSEIGYYKEENGDSEWCPEEKSGICAPLTSVITKDKRLLFVKWGKLPESPGHEIFELFNGDLVKQNNVFLTGTDGAIYDSITLEKIGQAQHILGEVYPVHFWYESCLTRTTVERYPVYPEPNLLDGWWIKFSNGFEEYWTTPFESSNPVPGHKYVNFYSWLSGVNEAYDEEM